MKIITCDICLKDLSRQYGGRTVGKYDGFGIQILKAQDKERDICFQCETRILNRINQEIEIIKSERLQHKLV